MSITKAQSFHFLWAWFSSCPCCCRRAPQAELAFSQTDKILLLPLKLPFFCLFVFLWVEKSSVECFTGYWVSARFRRGASKYSWGTGRSRIWVCLEHRFFPFPGSSYNIIRVPPQEPGHGDTLEGGRVVCSIPPMDRAKPSYYHSFGKVPPHTQGIWGCRKVLSALEMFSCLVFGVTFLPSPLRNDWKLHHFHRAAPQAEPVEDHHLQALWESHLWWDKLGAPAQHLLPCGEQAHWGGEGVFTPCRS